MVGQLDVSRETVAFPESAPHRLVVLSSTPRSCCPRRPGWVSSPRLWGYRVRPVLLSESAWTDERSSFSTPSTAREELSRTWALVAEDCISHTSFSNRGLGDHDEQLVRGRRVIEDRFTVSLSHRLEDSRSL